VHVHRALLNVYRALLNVHRALLSVYRALLSVCRALSSVYRALFHRSQCRLRPQIDWTHAGVNRARYNACRALCVHIGLFRVYIGLFCIGVFFCVGNGLIGRYRQV